MSATEAVKAARSPGIKLRVEGDVLALEAQTPPPAEVLERLARHKPEIIALLRPNQDGWSAEDWQAFFDERAGIAEFDGGQSRGDARALAFDCCVAEWLNQHPARSKPGRCAACGRPDQEGHAVVPFGTNSTGHTWLHPECWEGWYKARRAMAATALQTVGLRIPPVER